MILYNIHINRICQEDPFRLTYGTLFRRVSLSLREQRDVVSRENDRRCKIKQQQRLFPTLSFNSLARWRASDSAFCMRCIVSWRRSRSVGTWRSQDESVYPQLSDIFALTSNTWVIHSSACFHVVHRHPSSDFIHQLTFVSFHSKMKNDANEVLLLGLLLLE